MRLLLPPSRTVRAGLEATAAPLDRYTGVLYRALGVESWSRAERRWAESLLCVHTVEHGVVAAGGPGDATLDLAALASNDGPLIDLRSKEYVRRAPLPVGHWTVRVVSDDGAGRRLAVSHWNKHHKGAFVGALVAARPRLGGVRSLLNWAQGSEFRLEQIGPDALDLVV